jgi:hypothetical protein
VGRKVENKWEKKGEVENKWEKKGEVEVGSESENERRKQEVKWKQEGK